MEINDIYNLFLNCTKVNTDTRTIEKGELFIALKGEKFDANIFAQQALDKGAQYVIVDNPVYKVSNACILVANTLHTLQQLAILHRTHFTKPVIAIAGSNGKTTTKELLQIILESSFKTHCTKGNFNNHIGVPLTLLAMPLSCDIAIIEIGANHVNETKELCTIAQPTYGIITNNGKDHLEGFGNIEGVIAANNELFDYLKMNNGVAFVNEQDEILMNNSKSLQRIIYNSNSNSAHSGEIELIAMKPTLDIAFKSNNQNSVILTQLVGSYNVINIKAAIAIGLHFNVPHQNIVAAISSYKPTNNRSQLKKVNLNTFIVDCYNANPSSMMAALESFVLMKQEHKCVILGDMLELGDYTIEEHSKIILWLSQQQNLTVLLVGSIFSAIAQSKFETCANWQMAKAWFNNQHFTNYTILLKGSRGITLEKIID